jgi:hypothetical protein
LALEQALQVLIGLRGSIHIVGEAGRGIGYRAMVRLG